MSVAIPRHLIKTSDIWSDLQADVMLSIADAFVPALEGSDAAKVLAALPKQATDRQKELVVQFSKDGYKNNPQLAKELAFQMRASLSTTTLNQINLLLSLLGTRPGCLALTGHFGPFQTLSREQREAAIKRWSTAPLPLLRKGAAGFKGLSLLVYYRFHQIAWEACGYGDGPADDWKEAAKEEKPNVPFEYKFENDKIAQHVSSNPNVPPRPSKRASPEDAEVTISTDVLVIGSGSGGGVISSYLAQRGVRVLVAEKGHYLRSQDMLGREDQGYPELYDGGGLLASEDGSINVLAGSTFGGGTTVNWSASLKPRHFLREAWSDKHGLPYFRSPLFTNDLNAVCHRMGCSTRPIKHNIANSLLALGAQRAGQPVEPVPQNTGGHTHYCGKCQLGCISGHKQSGVTSWLRDAAESGNTSFLQNCLVERILFDSPTNRRAVGALAIVDGRRVRIDANKGVIVSSGSIQTPAVLLRSPELKYNRQIGKRLHLHPTSVITGYYDFPVNPWQGGVLTMVSNGAEVVDPEGWGCKIEVIASSPSIHAAFSPWSDAVTHKADMLRYNHAFELIVICRDRDAGEVFVDDDGVARFNYTPSKHDQYVLTQGILRACDIHMMAGACKIGTVQVGVPAFEPGVSSAKAVSNIIKQSPQDAEVMQNFNLDDTGKTLPETSPIPSTFTPVEAVPRNLSDPAYVAWRNEVAKKGAQPYMCQIGSAHQMGSCRMGATPRTGAVDPEGRVWGAKNLWVADASLLPEASGVNPMITTMATVRGVARNVAKDLGVESPVNVALETAAREARL